jgi:pimeloyl-ACP methyl ester carboxylesterase
MALFVLVHGGYHGGWCWEKLVPELERLGHSTIAPDLPCDDPAAGYPEYVEAVLDAMGDSSGEDVVLVGHSLGCYTVPLVALQRRVGRLILLCAVPSLPGEPVPMGPESMLTDALVNARMHVDESGLMMMSPADCYHQFYAGLDTETALAALRRLRPQGSRPLAEPWPLGSWPEVPKTVVLAESDNIVRLEGGIGAARKLLDGGEPVLVPGGHSVFLTDPARLAGILDTEACRPAMA